MKKRKKKKKNQLTAYYLLQEKYLRSHFDLAALPSILRNTLPS